MDGICKILVALLVVCIMGFGLSVGLFLTNHAEWFTGVIAFGVAGALIIWVVLPRVCGGKGR